MHTYLGPRSLIPILFFLLVLFVLGGCLQRETDIGTGAITGQPTEAFVIDSLTATAGTTFYPLFTNGVGTSLEVGQAQGLFAFFAIRFDLVADFPDSVRPDSMYIRFHLNLDRVWPDRGAGPLEVRVREIRKKWSELSFVPDSNVTMADRENWPVIDSVLIPTTADSFAYQVPETLWNRWLAGDTATWGLLFEPRNSGVVVQFRSAENIVTGFPEYPPKLVVKGTAWNGGETAGHDTTITRAATHDAYIALNTATLDSTRLYLSQGLDGRAALYFPMQRVTEDYSRAVARAELHLFADTLNPLVMHFPAQTVGFFTGELLSDVWQADPDTLASKQILGFEYTDFGAWNSTTTEYIFDVTRFAARWVALPDTNSGIEILTSEEQTYLAREVFHSPQSEDTNKRPKLYIWFTESTY